MRLESKYKVSILLPTLSADYIGETIQSISRQDFDHSKMELIIVATRIGDEELIRKFPTEFDIDTRILHCEEKGISASLNLGITVSKGEYIVRIDSDDIMFDSRISEQVEFLDSNRDISVVGGHIEIIDSHSNTVGFKKYQLSDTQIRSRILEQSPLAHPAVTMRKSTIERIGGYRNLPSEDTDLWVRILSTEKIANIDHTVIKYRIHSDQTSNYEINLTSLPRDLVWVSHFLRINSKEDLPQPNENVSDWIKSNKKNLCRNPYVRFALSSKWLVHPIIQEGLARSKQLRGPKKVSNIFVLFLDRPYDLLSWLVFRALRNIFIFLKLYKRIGF